MRRARKSRQAAFLNTKWTSRSDTFMTLAAAGAAIRLAGTGGLQATLANGTDK